jgi:hypothetical protein
MMSIFFTLRVLSMKKSSKKSFKKGDLVRALEDKENFVTCCWRDASSFEKELYSKFNPDGIVPKETIIGLRAHDLYLVIDDSPPSKEDTFTLYDYVENCIITSFTKFFY